MLTERIQAGESNSHKKIEKIPTHTHTTTYIRVPPGSSGRPSDLLIATAIHNVEVDEGGATHTCLTACLSALPPARYSTPNLHAKTLSSPHLLSYSSRQYREDLLFICSISKVDFITPTHSPTPSVW